MSYTEIIPSLYRINLPIPRGGFESFLDGWLIKDSKHSQTVLFETGPASVVQELVKQLSLIGASTIDYLVYTHIHLDHAGGAGQFLKSYPQTKILAPRKGRQHLVNPDKLFTGSMASLGDICGSYGAPIPVNEKNILEDGGAIAALTEIDTPGHAAHHSSYIYDLGGLRVLFAGEAAGCWFRLEDGSYFTRPATPHKFFYGTAMASLAKLSALKDIDLVCFPHSGWLTDYHEAFERARSQMTLWHDVVSALPENAGKDEAVAALKAKDPMLRKLSLLPENVRRREEFFIRQSAGGYLGWAARERG